MSTSRHCETNQSPSRQTVAENGRFIERLWHMRSDTLRWTEQRSSARFSFSMRMLDLSSACRSHTSDAERLGFARTRMTTKSVNIGSASRPEHPCSTKRLRPVLAVAIQIEKTAATPHNFPRQLFSTPEA